MRRREFDAACRFAERARKAGAADACTFGLLGHALSSLGRHAEAGEAYAEALKLGPDDNYVRHMVAAAGIRPPGARAPIEYVRAVFDGYADRFEPHLISLGYRVPGLIRGKLVRHPTIMAGNRIGPALDLGCGTGFIAIALSDLPVAPLVGVDASSRMLKAAATKQLYAELHEADLLGFLSNDVRRWQLMMAADVLPYFGALEEVLACARRRLAPGGWFVFSLEELLPDFTGSTVPRDATWILQRQGRYAQQDVLRCWRSARCRIYGRRWNGRQDRFEGDAPVAGMLVLLERPNES